jgi:hypothetical protein
LGAGGFDLIHSATSRLATAVTIMDREIVRVEVSALLRCSFSSFQAEAGSCSINEPQLGWIQLHTGPCRSRYPPGYASVRSFVGMTNAFAGIEVEVLVTS